MNLQLLWCAFISECCAFGPWCRVKWLLAWLLMAVQGERTADQVEQSCGSCICLWVLHSPCSTGQDLKIWVP